MVRPLETTTQWSPMNRDVPGDEFDRWWTRLEAVIARYGIAHDKDAAAALDISKQRYQQLKARGSKNLPIEVKIQILHLESPEQVSDAVWDLLPRSKRESFRACLADLLNPRPTVVDTKQSRSKKPKWLHKKTETESAGRKYWLDRLYDVTEATQLWRDASLSRHLQLPRQTLQEFVHGDDTSLPTRHLRLKMLWALRDTPEVSQATRAFLTPMATWEFCDDEAAVVAYWHKLLLACKGQNGERNDSQTASALGVTRQAFSKLKDGHSQAPSVATQVRIIAMANGWSVPDQVKRLLD